MNPVILIILAPFVGSFLGVLVRRLPIRESVIFPRSHCEACNRVLTPGELVPIISFVALGGRCRGCGAAIARTHLAIELAATLVPAIALPVLPQAGMALVLAASLLGWVLLALAFIDAAHWVLPDILTLPLLPAGLALTWRFAPWELTEHVIATAVAGLGLAAFGFAYRRVRGRDGLGIGDVKLLAAGSAWCGLAALPWILFGAAIGGLGVALLLHGPRMRAASAIPFGPPLCAAIWVAFLVIARLDWQ